MLFASLLVNCGKAKNSSSTKEIADGIIEENRVNISLLNQIRRLKGEIIQNGVPLFTKGSNSAIGNSPPLYYSRWLFVWQFVCFDQRYRKSDGRGIDKGHTRC